MKKQIAELKEALKAGTNVYSSQSFIAGPEHCKILLTALEAYQENRQYISQLETDVVELVSEKILDKDEPDNLDAVNWYDDVEKHIFERHEKGKPINKDQCIVMMGSFAQAVLSSERRKWQAREAELNAKAVFSTTQRIGNILIGLCNEHIQTDGLRFFGISWVEIQKTLEKFGYEHEEPF